MEDKNYKYNFTIKMLLVALKRKILTIAYFFVCFTIIGAIYSYKFYEPSYQANGFLVAETLNDNIYNSFSNVIKHKVPKLVVEELKNKDVTDKGKNVSIKDIENGIIVQDKPDSYDSYILEISFRNKNENITTTILNTILEQSCVAFNDASSSTSKLTKFSVQQEASGASIVTNPAVKMAIFSIAGLVIGMAFALVSGCNKYKINSTSELQDLDILTFELETRGKKNA